MGINDLYWLIQLYYGLMKGSNDEGMKRLNDEGRRMMKGGECFLL